MLGAGARLGGAARQKKRRLTAAVLYSGRHPGYEERVATFELDLAFEPEEAAAGLERLFRQRGLAWSSQALPARRYEFRVGWPPDREAAVTVEPLPSERLHYPTFFPRSLLQVQADDPACLDALRREIVLSVLRVMG